MMNIYDFVVSKHPEKKNCFKMKKNRFDENFYKFLIAKQNLNQFP